MGPTRKKPRTSKVDEPAETTPPEGSSINTKTIEPSVEDARGDPTKAIEDVDSIRSTGSKVKAGSVRQLKSKSSWYGTWPRKATPSTSIVRESILADKPTNTASVDLSRFEPKKTQPPSSPRPPSMMPGKSKETLDVTMSSSLRNEEALQSKQMITSDEHVDEMSNIKPTKIVEPPVVSTLSDGPGESVLPRPVSSSGWLGGWYNTMPAPASDKVPRTSEPLVFVEHLIPKQDEPTGPTQPLATTTHNVPSTNPATSIETQASTSWFGLWPGSVPSTTDNTQLPIKIKKDGEDTIMEDETIHKQLPQQTIPAAGSSWAFWSAEKSPKSDNGPEDEGRLAVAGETSQNHPEPAKAAKVVEDKKSNTPKKAKPVPMEVKEAAQPITVSQPSTPKPRTSSGITPSIKASPPNLLIPSVKGTYRLVESPGILQQIARLILQTQQQPPKHVFLVKDRPKIKKALAIGVHGLFPAAILRTVIGQPTGTSLRFAGHAAAAIRRWADNNGSADCEIEKVALEGEGKIGERVDNLWKLLLNWIDHVRKADFILVACHSQGVPVALMLVAKLIEFGVVTTARIGVCAMAGVSLGPFPDYKSAILSGSAAELFEFADPESIVSKRYEDALRVAMHYGVRVTYCGSIDDQLVSMESSTFSPASHPYIYRNVFVDGRIHAPDFLSHLVGFALKLRNLGVPDHGLIRELSAPLAGSLYTGEGHSRLYDDGKVYDSAVEFALETTSVGDVPMTLKKYEIPSNPNPYLLPWIMRGVLEEEFVKTELDHETTELLEQFDDWKPSTKVLKDVKYRLEAVRSKL